METTGLNRQSILMIQILLTDSKISAKVLENIGDKEKYKLCTIETNGNVTLGKTNIRWWNRLLNCQDVIPFESFALKVWDALVDMSRSYNKEAVLHGLSHEVVMKSVRDREYDWVVERLYECWTHVAQNSAGYQSAPSPEGDQANGQGGTKVINVRQT